MRRTGCAWSNVPSRYPAPGEVLLRVSACGVCRTDLHLADGDLARPAPGVVPGHEVVGEVVSSAAPGVRGSRSATGSGSRGCGSTCGSAAGAGGRENLCRPSTYTGWDADGGFAEYAVVPEAFRLPAPAGLSDAGRRAAAVLRHHRLPRPARARSCRPGGRLGIYGFGASAHLTAQLAIAQGAEVHVLTRGAAARVLALELGAASAGGAADEPPVPLDAAILFAPAGDLVPVALAALDQGGTLAVAGIHLSDIPRAGLPAAPVPGAHPDQRHGQHPRRRRGAAPAGGRLGMRARVTPYPFGQADRALDDLAAGLVTGAAVLTMG